MTVATKANVRTANAAKDKRNEQSTYHIAFSGGAVMGMCVAGLGASWRKPCVYCNHK